MTVRDLLAVLLLLLLVGGLASATWLTDRVYLPRHSDARDLPWAAGAAPWASDEPINTVLSDKVNLLYPDLRHALDQVREDRIPEWNAGILGGVPHAANPLTGVFYPPNWLLLLVDPLNAPLVAAALHVFLAGLFMLLFLRMAGLRPVAALIGGLALAFSGWTAAHLQNTPLVAVVAWIPLGLFAIESRLRGHQRWSLMLLSLSVAMMWLAGFPQLAVLGTFVLALYGLIGIAWHLPKTGGAQAGRHAGAFVIFGIVGALLASVQMLPTLELMPYAGHRERAAEDLVQERFRIGGWTGLVMPGWLGDPTDPGRDDWRSHWGARLALGQAQDPPQVMNWSERTVYPGVLVLVLAVIGVVGLRDRVRWSLLGLAALGVLLASSPPMIRLAAYLPGFDVGAPARAVVIPCVALAALAGFGVQALVGGSLGRRAIWRSRILLWCLAALPVAIGIFLLWAWVKPDGCLWTLVEGLKAVGLEESLGGGASHPTADYVKAFAVPFEDLCGDLLRLFLLLGAGWALLYLRRLRPSWGPALVIALLALVTIDLLSHFVPVNLPVRREGIFRVTPGIRFLQENLGTDRFMRVSEDAAEGEEPGPAECDIHVLFPPNLGLLFGLQDAQGYREQVPRHYLELWRGVVAHQHQLGMSGIAASEAASPILDLARVRYLIAARPLPALGRPVFPEEPRDGTGFWIYENQDALPHAFVVHAARSLPVEEARAALRNGTLDPRQEVALESWLPGLRSSYPVQEGVDTVASLENRHGKLSFEVETCGAGYLVVTDTWFKGWKAFVTGTDGKRRRAPVLLADTCFRAIPVEAGRQLVELVYEPLSITLGGVLTGLGWIGILLLPLVRRTPARRHPADATRSAEAGEAHA